MALTYAEMAALARTPSFVDRIEIALVKAAMAGLSGKQAKKDWIKKLRDKGSRFDACEVAKYVVITAGISAASSDAEISAAVEAVFEALA